MEGGCACGGRITTNRDKVTNILKILEIVTFIKGIIIVFCIYKIARIEVKKTKKGVK